MKKRQGLIVVNQKVRVKKGGKTYWEYANSQGSQQLHRDSGEENPFANPDVLAEPNESVKSEELLAIISVLDEGGEKILTKRQRKAFQLVVREGKSLREAGKKMHCSYEMVRQFIKSGAVNLRKLTLTKMA